MAVELNQVYATNNNDPYKSAFSAVQLYLHVFEIFVQVNEGQLESESHLTKLS